MCSTGQYIQHLSRVPRIVARCFPARRDSLTPPPYPRSPLREFTPCAPGRSSPFYSLLIAHRLIVFANDRLDAAESVTGPMNPAIPLNETIASIIHPARRTVLCREFHKLLPTLSCPGRRQFSLLLQTCVYCPQEDRTGFLPSAAHSR